MPSIIREPDSIVRVRNKMPGVEAHFVYVSSDGQRTYQIASGKIGEMRWRDYLEIQQYERARKWIELHEDTFITTDGKILLEDMDASEILPFENIHEILALPQESFNTAIKAMKKPNLVRIREVADEQNRTEVVEVLDRAIKSRGGRPSKE